MIFLDTNILVYAADDTDRVKFDVACEIVFKAAGDRSQDVVDCDLV